MPWAGKLPLSNHLDHFGCNLILKQLLPNQSYHYGVEQRSYLVVPTSGAWYKADEWAKLCTKSAKEVHLFLKL